MTAKIAAAMSVRSAGPTSARESNIARIVAAVPQAALSVA
jgi:hypothetical protein